MGVYVVVLCQTVSAEFAPLTFIWKQMEFRCQGLVENNGSHRFYIILETVESVVQQGLQILRFLFPDYLKAADFSLQRNGPAHLDHRVVDEVSIQTN